jgi:hypothetical protein
MSVAVMMVPFFIKVVIDSPAFVAENVIAFRLIRSTSLVDHREIVFGAKRSWIISERNPKQKHHGMQALSFTYEDTTAKIVRNSWNGILSKFRG